MKKALRFVGVAAFFVTTAAFTATFVVPPDREIIRRADAIILASPLTSYTQLTAQGGIETVTPMSIEQVIRGVVLSSVINVYEPGGQFGDTIMEIAGVPRFTAGERLLLFLKRTGDDRWSVAELVVGKFRFDTDITGRKLLVRDADEVVGWDPDLTPHRERHRAADRFLQFVRLEARGVKAREDYFVSDAPLRLKPASAMVVVPLATFSATSYSMTINGAQGARWAAFPNAVWVYMGGNEPGAPGGGSTAVTTAIASWNNDCGSNVNYVYAGTDSTHTQGLHAPDGANTVLFERNLSTWGIAPFSCSGNSYSGTLGIGGISSASGTNTVNGETFVTTLEADVEMNQGIANCTALFNSGDFNSAVTHELGHTLGFRHSDQNRASSAACTADPSLECSNRAIMKAVITSGINAALQGWDVNAVRAVYPGGTCVPPPTCTPPTASASVSTGNISPGQTVTLSAAATGTAPFSYQWYVGTSGNTSSPIAGATSSTRTVSATSTTNYWVRVSNSCGFANSNTVTVLVSAPAARHVRGDYDGDGITDMAVFRPTTTAVWIIRMSTTGNQTTVGWGTVGDIPAPADYDGDGRTDIAVFRPSSGLWFLRQTTAGIETVGWGQQGDTPVPADYDGDGRANPAVFRSSARNWYIRQPSGVSTTILDWGQQGDVPIPADYEGDRKADAAVYRPSSGVWFIRLSGGGSTATGFGASTDIPVPADYNGDGKAEIAIYRPSTGVWYIRAANGTYTLTGWGTAEDRPVPGDYNGNGTADVAIWRPSNHFWYVRNGLFVPIGAMGDTPLSQ